ncbi:MAG TPA: hypothetical protein VHQ04_10235, partial [Puia sp.]|nr:hypothetical protein [Puia sp.]
LFLFLKQNYFFNKTGRIIFRMVAGFILIVEITHGTYFCIKKILIEKEYGMAIRSDQYLFKSMELTDREMKDNKNTVICSNNYAIANMCSLLSVPIYCEIGKLQKPLHNSLAVRLIVAADTTVPGISVPLLSDPVVKPDFVFKNVSYYIVNLPKTNF